MKHLPVILLIATTILFYACRQASVYPPALLQAEELMDINPDSSKIILESVADTITSFPEEAQIYYQLLMIQVNDKLYIPHTSDSIVNKIVSFYENYGDNNKLMEAYYYQGRINRDMNNALKALDAFQKAVDLNCSNTQRLPIIYSQMGYIFSNQGLYDEAMKVHKKAMHIYEECGENNRIIFTQRDIARMFDMKEISDSALYYYKKACRTCLNNEDSAKYYRILGEVGGFLYENGQMEKAKQLLKSVEQNKYIQDKSYIYSILGHLYKEVGKNDSAYYYYKKTLGQYDIKKNYYSHKNLYVLEKEKGNYIQAVRYIDKALRLKDSIDVITQTEAVAKINALYNYQHITEENSRLKLKEEKLFSQILLLLFIIAITISCIVLWGSHQKRKHQLQLFQEQELRRQIEDKYANSKAAIHDNKLKIKELETALQNAIHSKDEQTIEYLQVKQKYLQSRNDEIILFQKEEELRIKLFRHSTLYKEFQEASQNDNINISPISHPEKWALLQRNIDEAYPHFTERLKNIYPQLSQTELYVCLLTKIGIPPSNIARILKYSKQNISNIRTRIFKRISYISLQYDNFSHFIEEL